MSTIRANSITNSAGTGAPDFPNGVSVGGSAVTAIASQAEAEAGTSSTTLMTPQRAKQAIDALVGAANAGLAAGDIGTYAFMIMTTQTNYEYGSTYAGSSLQPYGFSLPNILIGATTVNAGPGGTARSGTWMAMGDHNAGFANATYRSVGLFMRIA